MEVLHSLYHYYFGTILIYTSYKAYQALQNEDIYYYEEVIEELS